MSQPVNKKCSTHRWLKIERPSYNKKCRNVVTPNCNNVISKSDKKDNPLRLITSCCGTAIENLSAFREFYLQPLARKQPSFITDTTDLLNRIEELNKQGPFLEGTLLVSWDVVSMIPNIDNELSLRAVKRALETRDQLLPSTNCIIEAVEI